MLLVPKRVSFFIITSCEDLVAYLMLVIVTQSVFDRSSINTDLSW